jgi:hypothetical protein
MDRLLQLPSSKLMEIFIEIMWKILAGTANYTSGEWLEKRQFNSVNLIFMYLREIFYEHFATLFYQLFNLWRPFLILGWDKKVKKESGCLQIPVKLCTELTFYPSKFAEKTPKNSEILCESGTSDRFPVGLETGKGAWGWFCRRVQLISRV